MLARALGASSALARLASTPARSFHASNMMKFVKKGVVMADAPFEPPPKQSPSSRSSTRKRTTKAEKDAELAKKAASDTAASNREKNEALMAKYGCTDQASCVEALKKDRGL